MNGALPENAVLLSYHRSSSQDQRERGTHTGHLKALREDAEKHNWPLHRFEDLPSYKPDQERQKGRVDGTVFVDETHTVLLDLAVSAEQAALWERPAGRVLLEKAVKIHASGRVPVLRATFLDRLIRLKGGSPEKSRERGEFIARLLELEATIYTLNDGWLPPDKLETSIRLSIVEADADTRHRRMVQGKLAAAEQAYWPGGCVPVGYRLKLTGGTGRGKQGARSVLDIDDEGAALVRRIYELAISGVTSHSIALSLNAEGLTSPSGSVWRPPHVRDILACQTYRGTFHYNKQRFTTDLSRESRKDNPSLGLNGSRAPYPESSRTLCGRRPSLPQRMDASLRASAPTRPNICWASSSVAESVTKKAEITAVRDA